ncbi:hypothetical protein niasHT_014242 [Heterodera trifolii]|uniref:Uncharacterized protein n=1 Tax=Heterodera trifolii TaxID=157864 RepID=A0ABD2KX44_9BILA
MLIFLIVISSVLINSALGNAPTDDENNDQQQDNASGSGKLMKGMVWLLAASSGLKGANAVGDNGAQIVQVNPTIPPANAPLPPSHSFNLSDFKPHTQLVPNVPRKIGQTNAVGHNGAKMIQVNPTIAPANAPLPPKHAVNLSDLKPHTQLVPNVPRKIGKNANNNGKKNGNQ